MNPLRWSANVKALMNLVTLVVAIVGSAAGGASYIGSKFYAYVETQTLIVYNLREVRDELVNVKTSLASEGPERDKAIGALKSDVAPRIDDLEKSVNSVKADAVATKQRVDDMREDLLVIKGITTRTLSYTQSHDDDIKATRRAVAPKSGDRSAIP